MQELDLNYGHWTEEQCLSNEIISKKEKLLIEFLIADREAFLTCFKILKPSYFEAPLDRVVESIIDHFHAHHQIASIDIIEAETGILLKQRTLDGSERSYLLEEIETHCRNAAMTEAILASVDLINSDEVEKVQVLVRNALMVKLDDSVGTSLFMNPKKRIEDMPKNLEQRSMGINALDILIGFVRRGELGMFFAETGGGKSVTLANIAIFHASQGLNVLIPTLELSEELYSKRMDSIATGFDIAEHADLADEIEKALYALQGTGSFGDITTKKLPYHSTPNDIRTLVMEYHLKYGYYPDVLIVDYLQLMAPDTINKNDGVFQADEAKTFGLREVVIEYNMYGYSAGQINRDGYEVKKLGPNHIAGGISVINAIDWGVGLVATEEDIDNNQVQAVQMKVRNNGKTKSPLILYRCPKTLKLSDKPFIGKNLKTPVKTKTKVTQQAPSSQPSNPTAKQKLGAALKLKR